MAQVHKALAAVQKELAHAGIGKLRKNQDQNYYFRGVDDVFNVVSPLFAQHELFALPSVLDCNYVEIGVNKSGSKVLAVQARVQYRIVCATDDSAVEVVLAGEGRDVSDKATNKAMSQAIKYALLQMFLIPTEETAAADADLSTVTTDPAPVAEKQQPKVPQRKPAAAPAASPHAKAQKDWIEREAAKRGVLLADLQKLFPKLNLDTLGADDFGTVRAHILKHQRVDNGQ